MAYAERERPEAQGLHWSISLDCASHASEISYSRASNAIGPAQAWIDTYVRNVQ